MGRALGRRLKEEGLSVELHDDHFTTARREVGGGLFVERLAPVAGRYHFHADFRAAGKRVRTQTRDRLDVGAPADIRNEHAGIGEYREAARRAAECCLDLALQPADDELVRKGRWRVHQRIACVAGDVTGLLPQPFRFRGR